MKQYIDKDILMGQLNVDLSNLRNAESEGYINEFGKGKLEGLEGIADFILHFCGKDVDLEKEYKDFVEEDPVYNKLVNGIVGKAIAKHFFELAENE